MKHIALIIFISMLLHSLAYSTAAQVAQSYVEPDESYVLQKMSADGSDYWIVVVDGSNEMLINSNDNLVTDKSEIEHIFATNLVEENDIDGKTNTIKQGIAIFNYSQYPERAECERITGVDKKECYDKESCIKACYAVPLCAMQIRDDLINAILEWNTLKGEVDSAILNAESAANTLDGKDENKYKSAKYAIQDMIDSMEMLESADLYEIQYCAPMNISYESAEEALNSAEDAKNVLKSYDDVISDADELYENMNARISYFSNRANMYHDVYSQVLDLYIQVSSDYEKQKFVDEEIEAMLKIAENYTNDMKRLKNSGNYRRAIDAGEKYADNLTSIKNRIKVYGVQYELMESKANKVLERITKAKSTVKNSSGKNSLNGFENEVNAMIEGKINAKNISAYSNRIDKIDDEVKNIVANAVLGEEEEEEVSDMQSNVSVDEHKEEVNNPAEPRGIEETVFEVLCKILTIIKQTLGVDIVDAAEVC